MSESAQFNSFVRYRQLIIDLTTDLKKLKEYGEYLKLENGNTLIDEVLKRIANDSFNIAIVGEFKRGKSTLINALLGKDILPTDILPCSATLNRITYNVSPLVKIEYKDGKVEEISIDNLPNYVTKLTDESTKISEKVKEATVYYPINYCKNNVDIIDTPGLNDDNAMTDVTLSVLPQVDAAILVIMAQSPFSEYERDFLENKLLTNDLGRILFVVTGIDRCDEDEVDRVLKSISDRIEKYVLKKAVKTLGENSEEFAVYRRKLGKPKVFGISAKQALKAKIKGDDALLEKSCFPKFEKQLELFLTEDRGAVVLQVPVNRILSASAEILKNIEMQENALSMEKEEFQKKYAEALEEIKTLRQKKKEELVKINTSATEAFNNLQPLLNEFWPTVEKEAMKIIDNVEISKEDIKKDNIESTQERILSQISDCSKSIGQNYSERIQIEIEKALDKEAERLQSYGDEMLTSLDKIHNIFVNSNNSSDLMVEGIVSSTICSFLAPGFAGIWTGYRIAGMKGALVGGISGFGGAVGAGMIIAFLGIPFAWPALLAMSVASVFTGNWITKKIFAKDEIEKFRTSIKEAVASQFSEMKEKNDFTKTVRDQVNTAFNALKEKIENETETVLNDTENTLDELKTKIERENIMTEKEKEELKEIAVSVAKIMDNANKINNMLISILDK
ncbi:dynamin family protein [Clostridium sp.]|uniref:dynamin family protein n=1 Tax=Clostridium sp. TaxID=1506 RepID=UPI00261324BC|nr:dynamin family protein [Clostridium sp.]